MKINGEVKIRKDFKKSDLINIVDMIVEFVISKYDGELRYTPYYEDKGLIIGIVTYLMGGVEFDDGDKDVDMYEMILQNEDLKNEIARFECDFPDDMNFIVTYSHDIIEFKKREYIHRSTALEARMFKAVEKDIVLSEAAEKIAKQQSRKLEQEIKLNEFQERVNDLMTPEETKAWNDKMMSGDFDMDSLMDSVVKKFIASDAHTSNKDKIIDAKNKQITELNAYKQTHKIARNVQADK